MRSGSEASWTLLVRWVVCLTLVTALLAAVEPVEPTSAAADDTRPETHRVAGADRFATAAAVSAGAFAPGVGVVYVATGESFADALAGGPLAAQQGAPILLTARDSLPEPTTAELQRLLPGRIVALGGPAAVSDEVVAQLGQFTAGTVSRLAGPSRFETAAAISAHGFQPGVDTVYLATGQNFPDALAGGAAGGVTGGPVLLIARGQVPEATGAELARLAPKTVALLGGTAAVSDDVVMELGRWTSAPTRRLAGADRISTAIEISDDTHPDGLGVNTVYLATAGNFPDALTGAPAVAREGGALLLTRRECLPLQVRDEIARLTPQRVVVLGGLAAVSAETARLETCAALPPPPSFQVGPAAAQQSLPPIGDSGPRDVAVMTSPRGNTTEFVEDEVLVTTHDPGALQAFLANHGGQVLETIAGVGDEPPVSVVRLAGAQSGTDRAALGDRLQWLSWHATGNHVLSSTRALDTLVAATAGRSDGLDIGINFVAGSHDLLERDIIESMNADPRNPFEWFQFRGGPLLPRHGTAEAWRMLALAGRDNATVTIGIIDGGFAATNTDYPPGVTGNAGTPNQLMCGDNPCPWHGTNVAVAAAGVMDNEFGSVGAAGPVGRLRFYEMTGGVSAMVSRINTARNHGVDIINMSFGGAFDAVASVFASTGQSATKKAAAAGIQVFTSAGNDGIDVDEEACFVFCWETEWHWPCENKGVTCVGGLADETWDRHPSSNYGYEWCGSPRCDVQIFAPYRVYVGEDPDNPGDMWRLRSGTSYSSPYVAGVMALIIAADPPLAPPGLGHRTILLSTAHNSSHHEVGRVVNARAAVQAALAGHGNQTPIVRITAPTQGFTIPYGGFNDVTFTAKTYDFEDGDNCCTIEWSTLQDGVFAQGASVTHVFASPGFRAVTATARDSGNALGTATLAVNVINSPPTGEIVHPVAGAQLYRDMQQVFQGAAFDPNQLQLPNDAFTWRTSNPNDGTRVGKTVSFIFSSTGQRTVTLRVTDAHGAFHESSIAVTVVDLPPWPAVEILKPEPDEMFFPGDTVSLLGVANSSGDTNFTYKWTATIKGTTYDIGTSASGSWTITPQQSAGGCGEAVPAVVTLAVTNSNGTGTAERTISILHPPC